MTDYRIKIPRKYVLDKREKNIYRLGVAEGRLAQHKNPISSESKLIGEKQEQEMVFHGI